MKKMKRQKKARQNGRTGEIYAATICEARERIGYQALANALGWPVERVRARVEQDMHVRHLAGLESSDAVYASLLTLGNAVLAYRARLQHEGRIDVEGLSAGDQPPRGLKNVLDRDFADLVRENRQHFNARHL